MSINYLLPAILMREALKVTIRKKKTMSQELQTATPYSTKKSSTVQVPGHANDLALALIKDKAGAMILLDGVSVCLEFRKIRHFIVCSFGS